jgi:transposase
MRRCIGLDVHREFAQVAIWEDGVVRQAGRIGLTPEGLRDFAASLCASDEVATPGRPATPTQVARLLERHVGRVVVSNPQKTRAIAEAKVTTDKVDAAVLAGLLAADYLPAVWLPDEATFALRRQVARRAHIVRQRTRLQEPGAVDPAPQPGGSLPGRGSVRQQGPGLAGRPGPAPDEQQAVGALLRQLDFHAAELQIVDAELGRAALERAEVRRLLTIPGVDATVAVAIVAAVGDFGRFSCPRRLVSYLGLDPRVRQSGGQPAQHGRVTKLGRAHARGMLVEAAWVAAKIPGPLRACYERVRARRGMQVAVVATARKLATLCWHLVVGEQDDAFARPSLTDKQAAGAGAARRQAAQARPEGHGGRLFPQGGPPARAGAHRAGRGRLPPARRRLATQAASGQAPVTTQSQAGVAATTGARRLGPQGASCAAGLPAPRPCSSLRGRPRPPRRLTPSQPADNATPALNLSSVDRNVRARVGGTPSRPIVRVSASPSRSDPAAPGWERSSSRASASSSAWATSGSGLR